MGLERTLSSASSTQNPDSILSKRRHWDEVYDDELREYRESGLTGDEWYEEHQGLIKDWIEDRWDTWQESVVSPKKATEAVVLDVGTGNGQFLYELADIGFRELHGTDVVPSAVKLAQQIREDRIKQGDAIAKRVFVAEDDLLSTDVCKDSDVVSARLNMKSQRRYDLLHDKGTLDVFVLRREARMAVRAMLRRYADVGTIWVVTSSNLTAEELQKTLESTRVDDQTCSRRIRLLDRMTSLPKYEFGGGVGTPIATLAFIVEG